MEHRTVDLGSPVHYADFGGVGRPIVLVHGLGGSHANWLAVGPALARHGRTVAIDLAGHGLTRPVGHNARVSSNRELLGRFLDAVAREPAVLVGNSMGGYLSMAEAAAEPEKVACLVLVDPAMPTAPGVEWDRQVFLLFAGCALPGVGALIVRRRQRRAPEKAVRDTLALCCVDPSRIGRDVFDAHVAVARERQTWGKLPGRAFLDAQRTLMARLVRRRAYWEMVASIKASALIVQGDQDRLVRVEAARILAAARPDWRLEVLEGAGHVPQLEVPERFLAVVEPWLTARVAA